jgi:glycosyltransferase involved in cell wall biosynthesis
MRLDVLSRHVPDPEGTAAGRVLHATCEGLLAEGADVAVTTWSPAEPRSLPDWCTWAPLPPEPAWRTRTRALRRPRSDVVRLGWEPEGLAVADDPLSAAALPDGGFATLHYVTVYDAAALGRGLRPADRQDVRAERRLRGGRVLAYSDRVAEWVRGTAVPVATHLPASPLAQVEQPVAALVADWRWAPNRVALDALLQAWPEVRDRVPGAALLVAGRGEVSAGGPGVEVLGPVRQSVEVLGRAALLAFPCPATSGPKVKVLEAAASGLCVVTTPAGAEGVASGALVVAEAGSAFVEALVAALRDPAARAERAARARVQVRAAHAPRPAARARLEALLQPPQGS